MHDGANSIWQVRTGKFQGTKPLSKVKVPNWYRGTANQGFSCRPASERSLTPQIPLFKFSALSWDSRSHWETPEPSPIRSPLSHGCSRIVGDCGWDVSVHMKELMGRGAREEPSALRAPQGSRGRYSSSATSGRCRGFLQVAGRRHPGQHLFGRGKIRL